MDNLNELREIWHTADTSKLPNPDAIIAEFKKYRNKNMVKKAWMVIVAFVLTALMVVIVCYYKSTMFTTRIGEGFIIIADIILVRANVVSLKRLQNLKDCNNQQFINYLHEVQLNRIYYYRKTQVVGMAFSSIGLLFYLIENVYKDPYWGIAIYCSTVLCLAVLWLIVRPKAYKRRMEKFQKTLTQMEKLSKQLEQL